MVGRVRDLLEELGARRYRSWVSWRGGEGAGPEGEGTRGSSLELFGVHRRDGGGGRRVLLYTHRDRHGHVAGWEIFVPLHDENDVDGTLAALRSYLGAGGPGEGS